MARLFGLLQQAEGALERIIELRDEQLAHAQPYRHSLRHKQHGAIRRELTLLLASAYHNLGTCIRVQTSHPGLVYREEDRIRNKTDTYTEDQFVIYNEHDVQDHVKSLLGARVNRAEEMLVRALYFRREILQEILESKKMASEYAYTQDSEVLHAKQLVAQTLSTLAVLQSSYGLPTAGETDTESLSIYASTLLVESEVEFEPSRGDWTPRRNLKARQSVCRSFRSKQTQNGGKCKPPSFPALNLRDVQPARQEGSDVNNRRSIRRVADSMSCMFKRSSSSNQRPRNAEKTSNPPQKKLAASMVEPLEERQALNPRHLEHSGEQIFMVGKRDDHAILGKSKASAANVDMWRLVLVDRRYYSWYLDHTSREQVRLASTGVSSELLLDANKVGNLSLGDANSRRSFTRAGPPSHPLTDHLIIAGKSPFVDSFHAKLTFDYDVHRWRLFDMSPRKSGILVNGVRIKDTFLCEGDLVSIGGLDTSLKPGESLRSAFSRYEPHYPTPLLYRCERVWETNSGEKHHCQSSEVDLSKHQKLSENINYEDLWPADVFLKDCDEPAYAYFHILVICEYLRQSCKAIISSLPESMLGIGVSPKESRSMFHEVLHQGIPIYYWNVWIEAKIKHELTDDFMHYHRRREFNYFGA